MKKLSHLEKQAFAIYKVKCEIMIVLGLNDFQYNQLQFENAYKYIELLGVLHDEGSKQRLFSHAFFWDWWKNKYFVYDKGFLEEINKVNSSYSMSRNELIEIYNETQVDKDVLIDKSILRMISGDSTNTQFTLINKI